MISTDIETGPINVENVVILRCLKCGYNVLLTASAIARANCLKCSNRLIDIRALKGKN